MARQARSEATRQKIISSAVDLINEIGYPAAGLGDIIERAELTKGALYYHFDSKEALATAIIRDGGARMKAAFGSLGDSSPALESVIHGTFVVADVTAADKVARAGSLLLRVFGAFNKTAERTYRAWLTEMTGRIRQAAADGDLRPDLDIDVASETILGVLLGAELLSHATSDGTDVRRRMANAWELLLPAIVSDEAIGYFREFLSRESLRQPRTIPTE